MKLESGYVNNVLENVAPDEDLEYLIKYGLIPQMMKRRGRIEPLSQLEVVNRLFSVSAQKPGEVVELLGGELQDKGFALTPGVALEIADIVYYASRPKCPEYLRDPSPVLAILGISMGQAQMFCLAKYLTRLKFGDESNYKEIEEEVMAIYMNDKDECFTPKG